jgi:hypothetical protein
VHAAECGHVPIVSFLLQCDWMDDTGRQLAIAQSFVGAAANGRVKVCFHSLFFCNIDDNLGM